MLDPVGFSSDEYKSSKPNGRPRIKRNRGCGDLPGSGGRRISKQQKTVTAGRSAGSQDNLADLDVNYLFKV